MKYVWGKVWHKLYGTGPHPLTRNGLVTACSVVLPASPRTILGSESAPTERVCHRCETWTTDQQTKFRTMRKIQVTTVDPG
jgi:hypothetical protein